MENAADAVGKLFGASKTTSSTDTTKDTTSTAQATPNNSNTSTTPNTAETVSQEVKPAVEHEHVKKTHETEEQKFVEKERHQDHYHTTIQPLKDTEVKAEKHDNVRETVNKEFNHDDSAAKERAKADQSGFESSRDEQKFEAKSTAPTQVTENVHHHLHETIQPVIEKEVIDPSVTHKRINVHEKHQDPSKNHGVTTNSAMSVDDFKHKLEVKK